MNVQKLVAWNLRRLRVRRGISQEALAVDAVIDRTYVSRLERDMENPTIAVLERLAIALNVKIKDFFSTSVMNEKPPRPLPSGRKPK
ncbi:MAG TPA: helix-turn-helix transcriptional regulator [Alphaproteobacteria bacterium]|nr:helix-turn-helix transcriptional regulator [Alphaproteobacteria bacterium]